MFQRFRLWLASYSITAKSLVCAWVALTVLYESNQAFHDYIRASFLKFPHSIQEFMIGFLVPVAVVIGKWRRAKAASA